MFELSDAEQFTKGQTSQVYFTVFPQPEDKIYNIEIGVKAYLSLDKCMPHTRCETDLVSVFHLVE